MFLQTGTLTEEGLDMWGVATIQENKYVPLSI